jgi:magnesium chelatase subunit I
VEYFDSGGALQVAELTSAEACLKGFGSVPGLVELARTAGAGEADVGDAEGLVVASEVVLEGLVAKRKISRSEAGSYSRRRERRRPHGLGDTSWPQEI